MTQDHEARNESRTALLERPPMTSKRDTEPIRKYRARAERVLGEHEQGAPSWRVVPLVVVCVLVTLGMVVSLMMLATMQGFASPIWFMTVLSHLPPLHVWIIGGLVALNTCTLFYKTKKPSSPARRRKKLPISAANRSDTGAQAKPKRVSRRQQTAERVAQSQSPAAVPPGKQTRFPRALWILFVGIFINRLGSFVAPFLMLYLLARGYTIAQAGVVVGMYGLGSMAASLVGGYLADTVGRRSTIALSMFSSAIPVLALSQVSAMPLTFVCATAAGLTTGLYRPAASALLTDLVPSEQRVRAFAWYRFMLNLGFAVGPALAGFLSTHAFSLLFLADAASSLLFGAIALLFLPGGKGSPAEHAVRAEAREERGRSGARDGRFLFFLVGSLAVALVYFQMDSTFPLKVLAIGLSKVTFGMLLSLNGVIVLLLELPLSTVTQRFPQRWMIVCGWVLTGLGFGLTAIASSIPLLAITVVLWTVGEILHHPASAAYVADLAPVHLRGRYSGAWEFTWSLAQTVGPVAGAVAFAWNASVFWLVCGVLACLAALPLLTRQQQRKMVTVENSKDGGFPYHLPLAVQPTSPLLYSDAYQQARIELVLLKIWSQVLSLPLDALRVTSDFFGCGGDSGSLRAMVDEIHQQLHIPIEASECFDHPVLCHLAAHLVRRQKAPCEGHSAVASVLHQEQFLVPIG